MGKVSSHVPVEERGNWKQPPTKEYWAINFPKHAQGCLNDNYRADAHRTISTAIRILKGEYRTLEDGFAIEVEED